MRQARFCALLLALTLAGAPVPLNLPVLATSAEALFEKAQPETAEASAPLDLELEVGVDQELAGQIDAILNHSRHRRAFWGVDVHSLDEDKIIYSHHSEHSFSPASNAKVFTTAAALDRLGSEFRFRTPVFQEGTLSESGVLAGDLALVGKGDPDLAGSLSNNRNRFTYLDRMAQKVRQAGIRVIEGDIIGDDSYFPYAPYGKGWSSRDLGFHYGAAISALSFSDNVVAVVVRPAPEVGKPVRVSVDPPNAFLRITNRMETSEAGAQNTSRFYNPPGTNRVYLSGQLPVSSRGWTRYLTVDDPAAFTAHVFLQRLRRAGITVKGTARSRHYGDPAPADPGRHLALHESAPLVDLLAQINKNSHNLYAELVLRTLGAEMKGLGTDAAGMEAVYDFLEEAGISRETVSLHDGSGLSRHNLITPRAETLLLRHIFSQPYFPVFLETLARAGRDGTLKSRMRGTAAQSRVYAKTGSLQDVTTLGGYVKTRSEKTLAFSILINNHRFSALTARHAADRICALLAQY